MIDVIVDVFVGERITSLPVLRQMFGYSTLVNTHTIRNLPLFVRGFKNSTKAITATTKNIHRKQMLSKNGKGRP